MYIFPWLLMGHADQQTKAVTPVVVAEVAMANSKVEEVVAAGNRPQSRAISLFFTPNLR